MLEYYEQRQEEYEAIYAKPERQADLAELESNLVRLVAGCRVLELACGTGYWTRRMARAAASIHATDASETLIAGALASCTTPNVTAGALDAYAIPRSSGYNCVVAGFFLSHVPVNDRRRFLAGIAQAFLPGTRVVLFDNRYVEGNSSPISRRAGSGDSFQIRVLSNGSTHEILKNFPGTQELRDALGEFCRGVAVKESQYFWLASGVLDG
jgi:demethylmenaquinone methyltransferase/2-methoxy-6-polyprenyl-1,4-benzoquinol methylase